MRTASVFPLLAVLAPLDGLELSTASSQVRTDVPPLLTQRFGPPLPLDIDGDWHGSECIGVAGEDDVNSVSSSSDCVSRRLHHLPGFLSTDERASLVSELERRRADSFDTELDTVDHQATFMCRVIEGGAAVDESLAAQLGPLCDRITAFVRQRFECDTACISELLIRRYLPSERRRLEAHFDVSAFATAIVSLSDADEYEGGLYVQGVPGVPSRRYVSLAAGDGLVHRFDTMHGVHVVCASPPGHSTRALCLCTAPCPD